MQQQQQHLMQMQPMMSAYYSNNVTTDHIQQYLDENKSLILKIVESQNSGKFSECAENQARLQRNLMYLAAIADAQPQQPTMHSQLLQYPQSSMMQSGTAYMQQQQQQGQQMTPQALMAARSSMLYSQQAYSALQQSQALHSHGHGHGHMGMSSAGSSSGLGMLQSEPHSGGGYTDFGRSVTRAGSSGDGEGLYLKSGEDGNESKKVYY